MEITGPSASAPLGADRSQMCESWAVRAGAPEPHPVLISSGYIHCQFSYVDEKDVRMTNYDVAAASSSWSSRLRMGGLELLFSMLMHEPDMIVSDVMVMTDDIQFNLPLVHVHGTFRL